MQIGLFFCIHDSYVLQEYYVACNNQGMRIRDQKEGLGIVLEPGETKSIPPSPQNLHLSIKVIFLHCTHYFQ